MSLKIGSEAPNFSARTTAGEIDFHEYLGDSWGILFSHPADFTPVCTTELAQLARSYKDFQARNVKVLAYSCDSLESHQKWIPDIEAYANDLWEEDLEEVPEGGKEGMRYVYQVKYPIIEGADRKVAALYGMIDEDDATNVDAKGMPMTVRSVYFIAPDKKIKAIITYPASTGRDFYEILRVVDSLQLAPKQKMATPVGWKSGQKAVILPFVKDEEAEAQFGKDNIEKRFPYLRFAKPAEGPYE